MKLFRTLLSLLLLITLPLYGVAGLSVDAKPACPMQMNADTMANHPCCADQHDGSNPCKPGQECKTGMSSLLAAKPSSVVPIPDSFSVTDGKYPLPRYGSLIWHPPRTSFPLT